MVLTDALHVRLYLPLADDTDTSDVIAFIPQKIVTTNNPPWETV